MNGPMPTMSIMLRALASLRPRPRSRLSVAFNRSPTKADCENQKGSKVYRCTPAKSSGQWVTMDGHSLLDDDETQNHLRWVRARLHRIGSCAYGARRRSGAATGSTAGPRNDV